MSSTKISGGAIGSNAVACFGSALIAIVGICLIMGIAHAQTASRNGTEVVFDLSHPIPNPIDFNWFTPGTKREHGAQQAMWEPLFLLDEQTGTLEPWLGLEIRANATQNEWTLKLRKDVFWSDKQPFNADDVVFTANLAINHDDLPAAEAATFRAEVESVQKVDDLTVTFKLRKPNPRFAIENFGGAMFSSFLIMPQHIWKDAKDPKAFTFFKADKAGKLLQPIGTGPYVLKTIDDKEAVWQRNDDWWGVKAKFLSLPEPKELIWRYSPDAVSSYQAIKGNDIDAGRELSPDDFAALKADNPKVIGWDAAKAWNDPCARQLEINLDYHIGNPGSYWNDQKLRQALSLLIDRQEIADVAYKGATVPSQTMFLENGAMGSIIKAVVDDHSGLSPRADIPKAQALIEAEGFAKGANGIYKKGSDELSLAINVNGDLDQDVKSVQVLVAQLKAAGIAARAVPVTTAELWGKVIPPGNYEAVYSWLSCGSITEPWTSMSRYTKDKYVALGYRSPGFSNTGRWNTAGTAAYTTIIDEIGTMPLEIEQPAGAGGTKLVANPDIPKRVVDAYKILNDEMPFIPLVQSAKIIPFNTTYWTGWPTMSDNYAPPMHSWSRAQLIIHRLKKAH
ncbi:ABC transporter substrate-binding protein [Mesorhizobium sp. CA15]|uniref:ABC transporter substrate-binding protein n=1 Tax=Mesorhizobium sp. CA15 TaxID=2876641 RepID=UPI001CD0D41C|nr:ABC transporter substrate-binding protein [Mesorhizobium sp. CA15]MBZ9864246.1 ABC transporter substrate-binding protein [Mesorhizobium sp. CA15]